MIYQTLAKLFLICSGGEIKSGSPRVAPRSAARKTQTSSRRRPGPIATAGYNKPDRSLQSGLVSSINRIFQSLCQFFNCFSREIASCGDANSSTCTRRNTLYSLTNLEPRPARCCSSRVRTLLVTPIYSVPYQRLAGCRHSKCQRCAWIAKSSAFVAMGPGLRRDDVWASADRSPSRHNP